MSLQIDSIARQFGLASRAIRLACERLASNKLGLLKITAFPIVLIVVLDQGFIETYIYELASNSSSSGVNAGELLLVPAAFLTIALIEFLVWGLLVVLIHRFILSHHINESDDRRFGSLFRFLLQMICLGILASVVYFFISFVGMARAKDDVSFGFLSILLGIPISVMCLTFIARFSLSLPAAAVGKPISFLRSAQLTKDYVWLMVLVTIAFPLITTLTMVLVSFALPDTVSTPILYLVYFGTLFVEVATLSVVYQWLLKASLQSRRR